MALGSVCVNCKGLNGEQCSRPASRLSSRQLCLTCLETKLAGYFEPERVVAVMKASNAALAGRA